MKWFPWIFLQFIYWQKLTNKKSLTKAPDSFNHPPLVQVVDDLTERVGDLERRTAGIGRGVEPCPDRQMLVPYLSNEEKPGCLGYIGITLPAYVGIQTINHYKDPYQPV